MKELTLRKALPKDAKQLFLWKNDALVRRNSLSAKEITWEEHEKWFQEKLAGEDCMLFIAETAGEAAGQIRLDISKGNARISYCLAPAHRGKGLGASLLAAMEAELKTRPDIKALYAEVKADNQASQKCFERLDYSKEGTQEGVILYKKVVGK